MSRATRVPRRNPLWLNALAYCKSPMCGRIVTTYVAPGPHYRNMRVAVHFARHRIVPPTHASRHTQSKPHVPPGHPTLSEASPPRIMRDAFSEIGLHIAQHRRRTDGGYTPGRSIFPVEMTCRLACRVVQRHAGEPCGIPEDLRRGRMYVTSPATLLSKSLTVCLGGPRRGAPSCGAGGTLLGRDFASTERLSRGPFRGLSRIAP